jgi:bifunctional oligoribonuclease and PAP phosphatase NrnA
LTTHVRPDGDGLGSILALAETLRHQGKEVRLTVASIFPPRYAFLDPQKTIKQFVPPGDEGADVIIVMDTGTWNQLDSFGPFLKRSQAVKVVIDHHLTQDDLGAVRFVDATAEATGRLAYDAILALGGPLTATVADCLFVAVAYDTGWFHHRNMEPATFALASELMSAGACPAVLFEQLNEQNSLGRLKLHGPLADRLCVTLDGRVAYSEIHRSDYAETGATPQDTEDMINFIRSLAGPLVYLLFMEQPRGGVKVSFRSRGVDVARIAEQLGGGGHRLASGATVEAPLDEVRARVLRLVTAALDSPG